MQIAVSSSRIPARQVHTMYQQPPQQPQWGGAQMPPGYPGGAPGLYGPPPGQPAQPAQPAGPPPAQPAAPPPAELDMWFNSIDSDRSGLLDAKEIQQALALGNLRFSITDVDAMVRAFEKGDERKLNKEEFGKLHAFLTGVQASFSYFDQDRTNSLGQEEVAAALKQTGFSLDPPVLKAMISKHDPDNSKNLSLDEFIRLCLFLQSCVRTFSAFDPQRQGRITLDFGQFVYCLANVT